MKKTDKQHKTLWILIILTCFVFFVSLMLGSTTHSFSDFYNIFDPENQTLIKIIFQHRLPRSLTAILTGIALPLSGWVLQEYFRNPLAGPSVLGVTSSAGLGVAIIIVLGSSLGFGLLVYQPWFLILGALFGAFATMFILLIVAKKITSTTALIIVGFMIAALSGSLIGVLEFFASDRELKSYVLWSFGSLNGLNPHQLIYFSLFTFLGLLLIRFQIPSLIKMQLGENYARTMGVNVSKLRLNLIIASSLLTGVCTALVGPIAFIGLAVPHICRIYLKTSNFYLLFAYIIILGILFMLIFSMIAELFPGGALPINIITALFGAPIVLSIIFKNRSLNL